MGSCIDFFKFSKLPRLQRDLCCVRKQYWDGQKHTIEKASVCFRV